MALNLLLYYSINWPDQYCVLVSPIYGQSKKSFMDLAKACGISNPLVKSINSSDLILTFNNGSVIRMVSAESRENLRGFTATFLVLDESAYIDEDVWNSILRPTVMIRGKKVLFISTPNSFNWFKKIYDWGESPEMKDWESYRISSSDNPFVNQQELELARMSIPEKAFQQEFLGIFVSGGGSLFNYEHTATLLGFQPIPDPKQFYYAGLDLAISGDYTVLTIMDKDGNVVDMYRENRSSWEIILNRVIERIKKWRCQTLVEKNSIGSVIVEQLTKACPGLITPFTTTQDTKQDIIESLKLSFIGSLINIPIKEVAPAMHSELSMFTYKLLPSGKIAYSAPSGGNDDIVMSLAFCDWHRKKGKSKGTYAVQSGRSTGHKLNDLYKDSR